MAISLYISDRFISRKIEYFNEFSFNPSYDSVASTFGFSAYFNPNNPEHKEVFCVSHFHDVTIFDDDVQILHGVIVNQIFEHSSTVSLLKCTGYSLPGVIENCEIPPSIYPLQSDGLSLTNIAQKLIKPFEKNYGLKMFVDPSVAEKMNKSFKSVTASPTQKIKDYLTSLASQKNIVMSHDIDGRLLFTEANTKQLPFWEIDLTKPTPNGFSYSMAYNGENIHSHITVQKQSSIDGGNAGEFTIRNPYVIGTVYRPKVINQTSGDDIDSSLAARRELGNELRNINLTIKIDRWTIDGKMIMPNSIISIYAPQLYIYHKCNWFVESVNYTGDTDKKECEIHCVLPEVYNDEKVVSIFRDINLHAKGE